MKHESARDMGFWRMVLFFLKGGRRDQLAPPDGARTYTGAVYPLTQDDDGRWRLHSERESTVVNGLAHAMRCAQTWERIGNKPPARP